MKTTNPMIRELNASELGEVAGGRIRAIIVLGDCSTPPIHLADGVPVIIYNPWLRRGSPERAGTGTSW